MESIFVENIGNMGVVGMFIAALIFAIKYVVKSGEKQQTKTDAILNEYIDFVKQSNSRLIDTIDKNTDSFHEMTQVYRKLIDVITEKVACKK